jgi:hypothetical protein
MSDHFIHFISLMVDGQQSRKRIQALEERAMQRDREIAELSARFSRAGGDGRGHPRLPPPPFAGYPLEPSNASIRRRLFARGMDSIDWSTPLQRAVRFLERLAVPSGRQTNNGDPLIANKVSNAIFFLNLDVVVRLHSNRGA